MSVIGVIPARLGSTRLPRKVLADLCGKPVIRHVYERACRARSLSRVIVACDDEEILRTVRAFKGHAVLTSKDHRTGTERVTEVAHDTDAEVVINIQGDEPLLDPLTVDDLAAMMLKHPEREMGTVVKRTTSAEDFRNPDVVKAVVDDGLKVLYFSRAPIPARLKEGEAFCRHVGLYAYRRDFLFTYKRYPRSYLELNEGLEQLRALENGHAIWAVETRAEHIGVDTPAELEKARHILETKAS